MTAKIILDNIDKVKEFVGIAMSKPYDVDLISGKYVINGKSIMGVFSLDLTKPVIVNADTKDDSFLNEIEKFVLVEKK